MRAAPSAALLAAIGAGRLDPLAFWGELTGYGGFTQRRSVRAAIQIDPAQVAAVLAKLPLVGASLAAGHRKRLQKGQPFATVRLPLDRLPLLAHVPGVLGVMPGFVGGGRKPRPPRSPLSAAQLRASPAERAGLLHQLNGLLAHGPGVILADQGPLGGVRPVSLPPLPRRRSDPTPLIGIVDFGCAFLHPALVRPGAAGKPPRTRVLALWDQGRDAAAHARRPAQAVWPWRREASMGYGRVADSDRLDQLVASVAALSPVPLGSDDARLHEACYVAAEMPELLTPTSHGTAVLGLAAGRGDIPDAASDAEILFVQLPRDAVRDLSGGWLTAYLLDALAWLEDKAAALGRRLIVNLSLGSHAGSHDGESLVERLLDDFARRHVLVLAAGNAASRRGHAEATLAGGSSHALSWLMPERDPTQSFLEVWYTVEGQVDLADVVFGHEQVPALRLRGPGAVPLRDRQGGLVGAVVHVPPSPGQPSGRLWIALAPTLRQAGATAWAPGGRWSLSITPRGRGRLQAHAWLERDEPGVLPLSDRPDSVLEAPSGSAWVVNDCMTLTAQAAAPGPLVVGGLVDRRPPEAATLFRHTGQGPTRGPRRALDAWAPADQRIRDLDRGLPVLGNHSDPGVDDLRQPPRMKGTSLSAPLVLRWLYNEMVATPQLVTSDHLRARTGAAWPAPTAAIGPPGQSQP